MTDPISISVVIPTYNLARMLPGCIESVLSQTRPATEIIVVDDGSQDNTAEVVTRYGDRVRYIRQVNSGVAATRTRGIQEARGNWIALLDVDDLWYPPKLERQCALIEKLDAPALVCSERFTFTTNDPPPPPDLSAPPPPASQLTLAGVLRRNTIPTSAVMVPKGVLLAAGGFNKVYNHAEDLALWLQVGARIPMWVIPQPLIGYRLRADSLSDRSIYLLRDVEIQVIEDFCKQHRGIVSRSVEAQSIAGAHYRAGIHLSGAGRNKEALSEVWCSFSRWPFALPEYRQRGRVLPLARARLAFSAIRHLQTQPQDRPKRVLMFAYYFPPISSIGTLRTLQFTKYLDQFGWQSVVITVKQRQEPLEPQDNDLISDLPRSAVVVRTSFWSLQRLTYKRQPTAATSPTPSQGKLSEVQSGFMMSLQRKIAQLLQFPDRFSGWLAFAIVRGILSAWKHDVDVIYSSAPPYTGSLAGAIVGALTGKPVVSDFRDVWHTSPYVVGLGPLLQRWSRYLERWTFKHSAAVIHASPELSREACARVPALPKERFVAIPNGYDPDNFKSLPPYSLSDLFRIVHMGTFYPGDAEPHQFLRALHICSRIDPTAFRRMHSYFIGEPNWGIENADLIRDLTLAGRVEFIPTLPHSEALRFASQAEVLLLIGSNDSTNARRPAKFFEYLALQRPILALLHRGEMADWILESKMGVVVNPAAPDRIAEALLSIYHGIKRGDFPSQPDTALLERFNRRNLANTLAEVFERVSHRGT